MIEIIKLNQFVEFEIRGLNGIHEIEIKKYYFLIFNKIYKYNLKNLIYFKK